MLLVSSGHPNAVTADNGEIDDGNSNGALVAVETEDDEETDISMCDVFLYKLPTCPLLIYLFW